MSTKIYDAYIWEGNLEALQKELFKFREAYIEQCAEKVQEFKAHIPVADKEKGLVKWDIMDYLELKEKSLFHDVLNFSASVVVFPYNKKIIVQFFGIHGKLLEDNMLMENLQDFHYQNQTDPYFEYEVSGKTKEDMTRLRRNWAYRKKVWDNIYEKFATPAEVGFIFQLFPQMAPYWVSDKWKEKYGNNK